MANNFTPEQTHHFDQNMAQFSENVDNMIRDWRACLAESCCIEHAVLNFGDHLTDQVQVMSPVGVGMTLLAACRRLSQGLDT